MFWDDNRISIEDDTNIAFNEDVVKRYEAYGWHVQTVESGEDVVALEAAAKAAREETERPSFIRVKTVIGYPAPNKMNTGGVHGAALGDDEVAATKEVLGFDPAQTFEVSDEVINHTRKLRERGAQAHVEWQEKFDAWASANPEAKALFDRMQARELPENFDAELPTWDAGESVATRKASEATIQALAAAVPEMWGGSADLQAQQHRYQRVPSPSAQSPSPLALGMPSHTAATSTLVSVSTPWPPS